MKPPKSILTVFLFVSFFSGTSEHHELLESLPETKEDFIKSEKKVLATIDWLENTPINKEEELHKTQYALLSSWIINSPTVTVQVNHNVVSFIEKNSELLIIFMGGWTKYSLENNYSKDLINGNVAGLESVIRFYKRNSFLKKDEEMLKLIEIDKQGQLKELVILQLAQSTRNK
jgi:hypothetical protein